VRFRPVQAESPRGSWSPFAGSTTERLPRRLPRPGGQVGCDVEATPPRPALIAGRSATTARRQGRSKRSWPRPAPRQERQELRRRLPERRLRVDARRRPRSRPASRGARRSSSLSTSTDSQPQPLWGGEAKGAREHPCGTALLSSPASLESLCGGRSFVGRGVIGSLLTGIR
jgi:hypothetical protein